MRKIQADEGNWVQGCVSMQVDRDYFATLGLPLVAGRSFTAEETASAAPLAVITQSAAKHLWPGKNPLGRRIELPKRERQVLRRDNTETQQNDMFGLEKSIPTGSDIEGSLPERTLIADFGKQLGGKTRIGFNLGILSRHGFIERRQGVIHEGPLLDLALDHSVLAPRILDGALAELLAARVAEKATDPAKE